MAIERLAKEKQQHLDLKMTDKVGKKRRIMAFEALRSDQLASILLKS